jgi:hypothetical protein
LCSDAHKVSTLQGSLILSEEKLLMLGKAWNIAS